MHRNKYIKLLLFFFIENKIPIETLRILNRKMNFAFRSSKETAIATLSRGIGGFPVSEEENSAQR